MPFLRRLIDLTSGLTRPHHYICLNREAKQDIRMWFTFLDNFNGRAFLLSDRWDNFFRLDLYTDAAASKGYGAIFGKYWFGGAFPPGWKDFNITFLELFPIVVAVHIWGLTCLTAVCYFLPIILLSLILSTSKHRSIIQSWFFYVTSFLVV